MASLCGLRQAAEFAATRTKGAHVQIEGELRSREIATKNADFKQRIWETRVDSIPSWTGLRWLVRKTKM